ncbi:MAG: hypothetical protein ABI779_24185, partial [Acidobacteriota bacterium]
MPTWVKVVLVIVVVGFLAIVAGAILAARWVRSQGASLEKQGKALAVEAEKFGRGQDPEVCVTESLNRLRSCPGFICEAKVKLFLNGCVQAANDRTKLCAGVPSPTEIMQSARWQLAECERRGWGNNQRCTRMMGGLQPLC